MCAWSRRPLCVGPSRCAHLAHQRTTVSNGDMSSPFHVRSACTCNCVRPVFAHTIHTQTRVNFNSLAMAAARHNHDPVFVAARLDHMRRQREALVAYAARLPPMRHYHRQPHVRGRVRVARRGRTQTGDLCILACRSLPLGGGCAGHIRRHPGTAGRHPHIHLRHACPELPIHPQGGRPHACRAGTGTGCGRKRIGRSLRRSSCAIASLSVCGLEISCNCMRLEKE